jgi:hypothetical protein
MTPAAIIREATRRGITLRVDGAELLYRGPRGALGPELKAALKAHKPAIISELMGADTPSASHTTKTLRAAAPIEEADSGWWDAKADDDLRCRIVAALDRLPAPRDHSGRGLIASTLTFLRSRWFSEALKYGWSLEELFGVDGSAPLDNFEQWGLIVGLALAPRGGDVVEHLDAEHAVIRYRVGAPFKEVRRIERRFVSPDTSVVWWECPALVGEADWSAPWDG